MKELSNETSSSSSSSSYNEVCSTVLQHETFTTESKYVNGVLKFYPPMYVQRYEAVYLILKEPPWKDNIRKIIDFGCSEMGFFLYLKHMPGLEKILEVDIDERLMVSYASKAAPLNADYLFCKREKPLDVYLMAGSIAEYDEQLAGTDAVVAIEVLEHLEKDVLDKVPHNIFHCIKPKLAIFTTPNADFNELFVNNCGFRHHDHKFEWTRKEFYKWTKEITTNYPNYSVKFFGIGVGPEGSENLGCCTQMAVFEKIIDSIAESQEKLLMPRVSNYKVIRKYNYPFNVDTRTDEMKIFHEVLYRLKFTFSVGKYYNDENEIFEVPLSEFLDYIHEWCQSVEHLKAILLENGFYIVQKNGIDHLTYSGYMSESTVESDTDSMIMDVNVRVDVDVDPCTMEEESWDWDYASSTYHNTELPRNYGLLSPPTERSLEVENANTDISQLIGDGVKKRDLNSTADSLEVDMSESSLRTNREVQFKSSSLTISKTSQNDTGLNTAVKGAKTLKSWISSQIGL